MMHGRTKLVNTLQYTPCCSS